PRAPACPSAPCASRARTPACRDKPIHPASFYGGQPTKRPPPLPSRPAAFGSSTTSFYFSDSSQNKHSSSPFREPELVPDDDPVPGLAADLALPAPLPPDDTTTQWGSGTAPSWTPSVQEWTDYSPGPWPAATAAKIEIDGRDEDEEANWWDPATRRKHRRPGPGILPPLLADRLHNSEHSLFSVTVTPPDIKQPPPHHPTSPTHPASSPTPSSSSSSSASSTAPQPTPEEVRTAVPHPNAYYCRRHNGWVLLLWKSSSVVPPLARSFKRAHKHDPDDHQHADKSAHGHSHPPLPDQARRRKTPSCLGAARDQPFGQTNRTHHFHLYEHAVDARMLTPAFHRSEWEAAVLDKRKRRKLTLRGDDIDTAALAQALDAGAPTAAMEHDADGEDDEDAADEGDLLDLYVCCQCSFYCVASDVVPGVVPARYVEDFVKFKTEHPPPGKSKEVSLMMAWETILTIVENRLWKNEGRVLPVTRKAFQAKVGWTPTAEKIFQALGFEARGVVDNADHADTVALHPPSVDPGTPQGRRNRAKLLRAWVELSAWAVDYRKRFASSLKEYTPHPLWVRIENAREMYQTAVGAHPDQIPRGLLPINLEYEGLEEAWLQLGMTPTTYSWELLAFAYLAQCRCDPAHTIDHFSAFFALFSALSAPARGGAAAPAELQALVLEERARLRFTHDNARGAREALGFGRAGALGVELGDDVEDAFVVNAWREARARGGAGARAVEADEALRVVAELRGSAALRDVWARETAGGAGGAGPMTPGRAYATLEAPREVDDGMLLTIYSVRVADQPGEAERMREAVAVVAEARESVRLRRFLETGTDPGDVVPPARPDWPRGLNQLGNTCYLNSLLQYFYTITDLRKAVETLLNSEYKALEDDKLTDDDLKRHRVGGRLVTRREILRSKKFVGQLAGLFWDLEHADVPAVTPSIELAKLALVTSKDEDEDADADADADRGGTDSSHDTEATLVDDAPARAPASSASSPPGETGEPASASASSSASAASVLGKRRDREQEDAGAQMDVDAGLGEGEGAGSPAAVPSSSRVGAGAGAGGDAEMLDAAAAEGRAVQKQQQPPSLPPRKAASESVMMFGRQHDVSECMDNCMFQIETALLKFDGLGDAEEGKTSVVKRLFYGTLKQRLSFVPGDASIHEKEVLFSLLPVNVSDEGYDLYDGLGSYFDDAVEFEGKAARMEVTLVDLPPLLQIQLQRGQFDRETLQPYKSQAYVKFGETVYMDRFLDSADPEKKERSKAIHAALSACRDRIHLLTTGTHAPFGAALGGTQEFLQKQETVALPEADAALVAALGAEQDGLRVELEGLRARAAALKAEMEAIWVDERAAAYELTSVFIHRGSSPSWGHYFFYSRHLPEEPDAWFKYNDSDVGVVAKEEVLADTTGSTANPYMLVFVRKGADVVKTVNRFDLMSLVEEDP
ncbi:hypothetical protein HETIRDRAFT_306078, partial [Heterobasidion irregulare TC 32-1]